MRIHFPIIFQKLFSKFFEPFLGPQGVLPSIFEFPFSRYLTPYFFRRFDLISDFRLQWIETHDDYWTPWWRTANNFLQDFIIIVQSNIPISTAAPIHSVGFLYSFPILFQNFIQQFWALFWCPRGLWPLSSNSPSRATCPHIFSDVSTSFLTPSRDWDSWLLLNLLMAEC